MICQYGCSNIANYQFKNGKWCCSKNVNSCIGKRSKDSENKKGKPSGRKGKTGSIAWNKGLKKGFFREKNRIKFELFKKDYPNLIIELWDKNVLKSKKII